MGMSSQIVGPQDKRVIGKIAPHQTSMFLGASVKLGWYHRWRGKLIPIQQQGQQICPQRAQEQPFSCSEN